jgi:signal transduction histidine kinase
MKKLHFGTAVSISQVPTDAWRNALEVNTRKFHVVAAWVAILFDPLFAITDYFNIPESWQTLLYIRLGVAAITFTTLMLQRRMQWPSLVIVIVPFMLISLQNAYTYSLIGKEDFLGHNLNYMALLIGAGMFLAWDWFYSVGVLLVSAVATAIFIQLNPQITVDAFFIEGGLLLIAVAAFMFILIKTRYNLTVREIKARLALQISNEEIQSQNEEISAQAEEIRGINENLEQIVNDRTKELEMKNKALQEYAFINAHKLRRPVASILGLINIASKLQLKEEDHAIITHLEKSSLELDEIVSSITKTIERADTGKS